MTSVAYDPEFSSAEANVYDLYRELRDRSPVHRHERRDDALWVLSRYDDVDDALRDWRMFSSVASTDYRRRSANVAETSGVQLIETDPPRHDALRRVVRNDFSAKGLAAIEQKVGAEIAARVDALCDRTEVDVAGEIAWPLTVSIVALILGVPAVDEAQLLEWYLRRTYASHGPSTAEANASLRDYFRALEDERLARPRDDVLSRLMRAVTAGEISRDDADVLCLDLFEGGIDVPANLIANAVLALADEPEQRAALARPGADPASIRLAVEELARFDAPIQYVPRVLTQTTVIQEVTIPAGETVLLLLGSANRDERRFPDPDVLDLARSPVRNVAFGVGIHSCIGAPLARLEARIALPALLRALPEYRLTGVVDRPNGDPVMRALLELRVEQ